MDGQISDESAQIRYEAEKAATLAKLESAEKEHHKPPRYHQAESTAKTRARRKRQRHNRGRKTT